MTTSNMSATFGFQ